MHKVCSLFKIIRTIGKKKHLQIEGDKYCNPRFTAGLLYQKGRSFMMQPADTSEIRGGCWTICSGAFEECLRFGGQVSSSHH